MPEVNHAMRSATHKPRAEHDVGAVLQNWSKKKGIFTWVILQVGVLNDDHVARSCLEPRAQSCSLAKIALLQHELVDPPVRFRFKKLSGSIGRSVIDDDDFHVLDWRCADCIYDRFDGRSLVVTRDNDR